MSLIISSSIVDYYVGKKMYKEERRSKRKMLLLFSIFFNVGLLFVFKYFNFFIDSFSDLLGVFGFHLDRFSLSIVLPVGISFYTFQTLSYTIDIYRKQLKPTEDWIKFFAFVAFFPQLVAGPIEKARDLLPQFSKNRIFDSSKSYDGLRQFLWGLFKKLIIADNCAPIVTSIFAGYESLPFSVIIFGVILFSFQIYCDFSGYSDMAIGVARLLGFNLTKNFNFPFFSTSMAEMWRKWHISLSTWTGEYLFLPISKSKKSWGRYGVVFALLSTFLILGIWHGANWTFVVFGLIHGSVVSFEYFFRKQLKWKDSFLSNKYLISISGWMVTMMFWLLGMLFFRAESVTHALSMLSAFSINDFLPESLSYFLSYKMILFFIFFMLGIEWINRKKEFGLDIANWSFRPLRWSVYYVLIFCVLRFSGQQQEFIYFQF